MNGVVVVDKPTGPTSHDVVARVRRLVRPARVGHVGTLDPMATGVLVLCIGSATRLARFLRGGLKQYSGEIVFGTSTDSYDATGRITERRPADGLTLESVRTAAARFQGDVRQVPPAWSAKKVQGKRSYDLARKGEVTELAACDIRIESFTIQSLGENRASFRVVCSGGTYVRSLAHEMGQTLGCGAHLASLRRLSSGPFTIAESASPDDIERAATAGRLSELIRPLESLDLGLEGVRLSESGALLASAGRFISPSNLATSSEVPVTGWVRLLTSEGRLIGIGEVLAHGPRGLQPRIVLPRTDP